MSARTYGALRLVDNGKAWEVAQLEPHVAIRLKHFFPRIPKTSTGPFRVPNDLIHSADLEWFISRYPLALTDEDRGILAGGRRAFESQQADLERILLPTFAAPGYAGLREGQELRGYQSQAVEVLARRKSLLLGDEVGLGKTFTACGACLLPRALPAVIVCEPHVQLQWKRVVESFTTLRVHAVRKARPYTLPEADVYVFRYSQIGGWVDLMNTWGIGLFAMDEIQQLRTGTGTVKGNGSVVVSERAEYRLGLTATPIYNYGVEIWHVMRFIDPTVLGELDDFNREWTDNQGHVKDPKALGSYLREQHVFLRRTRRELGKELPPVNRIVDFIGYDAAAVKSIEDLAHQLAIKATTAAFVERGQAARELDVMVRHATGVAKAPNVADYVRILLEAGEPVVLVGWHRDVYDIWLEKLKDFNPVLYTGSESATQKDQAFQRFISGETDLLILSLRSGAGLDGLQERCSTVVFGELDWSPGIHHQVIGRLDRDRNGDQQQVMAIFLVTDEGSDPPIMEVLGLKASEASQIVDPALGVQAVNSDTSHLRTLVERYLDKKRWTKAHSGER